MTKIPYILEPQSQLQQQSEYASTPISSAFSRKARFKSLFQWHKSSHITTRPSTRIGNEPLTESGHRPQLSPRSVSENVTASHSNRTHSSDGPRIRKREKILTDPPPLPQAYRQALIHAPLETPVSFTEVMRSRQNSLSAKDSSNQDALEDVVRVKCAHRKTNSGDDTCDTKSKIFMLVHGPYLLQFPSDAEADTLPEKILILDRETVAFACDAVPGRPWVLQISKTKILMTGSQEKTLRPSWSRLTLRQPEDKRTVNTMLIIFNDSEELYTWLFALRKEIEHLGGIEYRPDIEHDDKTWRENLTRRFESSPSVITDSRRSSPARNAAQHATTTTNSKLVQRANTMRRPHSKESSTSSNHTATSLERLRDSLNSNGFSSNLARASATDSASSVSPITESFPSIGSIADVSNGNLSLRTYSGTSGSPGGRSKSQQNRSSILERRKLSANSLTLAQPDNTKAWKVLAGLPPTISGSPNDDAPKIGSLPKIPSLVMSENITLPNFEKDADLITRTQNGSDAGLNDSSQLLSRNTSHAGTVGSATKPKYSLFPVPSVPESKDEPITSPPIFIRPATRTQSRTQSRTSSRISDKEIKSFSKHRKTRSRTVTLELRQHRKSALLGVGQLDIPLRSPAVTDDMIMSNFGVTTQREPLSPMPVVKVPGLADLTFDLDFLRMPYDEQAKRPTATNQRSMSTRSVSSLRSDTSAAFSKAPVGPPPAGPLPAVPQRNSQASRSSQYSQHSQMSRFSSRRNTTRSKPTPSGDDGLSRSEIFTVETTSGEEAAPHKHTRTISSSLNGPPPSAFTNCTSLEKSQSRSRSRSRGRQKPAVQQT